MLSLSSSQFMTRKVKLRKANLMWFLFRRENSPVVFGGFLNKTEPSLPSGTLTSGFQFLCWGILSDKTPSPDFWSTSYFLKCISVHHQICPFWYEFKIQSSTCHKIDMPQTHSSLAVSGTSLHKKLSPFLHSDFLILLLVLFPLQILYNAILLGFRLQETAVLL